MDSSTYSIQKYRLTREEIKSVYASNRHSILVLTRGKCIVSGAESTVPCTQEDLVLIKPGSRASLQYFGGKYPLEFFLITLSSELLSYLSDEGVSLAPCFEVVPSKLIVVHSSASITMLIKNLCHKLTAFPSEQDAFASALFEKSILQMLIILILRACIQAELQARPRCRRVLLIDDVFWFFQYLLCDEISLVRLEYEFYVSRYHIAREFKKQTGDTVHAYIIKAKLTMCKKLIAEGKPITEVYQLAGFGGYNNFFRAFKREYNMTPKAYYNESLLL
ncbi:MAG: AraC family transcriptional regulator [Ruthenibacterium sp.]